MPPAVCVCTHTRVYIVRAAVCHRAHGARCTVHGARGVCSNARSIGASVSQSVNGLFMLIACSLVCACVCVCELYACPSVNVHSLCTSRSISNTYTHRVWDRACVCCCCACDCACSTSVKHTKRVHSIAHSCNTYICIHFSKWSLETYTKCTSKYTTRIHKSAYTTAAAACRLTNTHTTQPPPSAPSQQRLLSVLYYTRERCTITRLMRCTHIAHTPLTRGSGIGSRARVDVHVLV